MFVQFVPRETLTKCYPSSFFCFYVLHDTFLIVILTMSHCCRVSRETQCVCTVGKRFACLGFKVNAFVCGISNA